MFKRTAKEEIEYMIVSYQEEIEKNKLDYGDDLYHAYTDFITGLEFILKELD